jgi:hypothetical protein
VEGNQRPYKGRRVEDSPAHEPVGAGADVVGGVVVGEVVGVVVDVGVLLVVPGPEVPTPLFHASTVPREPVSVIIVWPSF